MIIDALLKKLNYKEGEALFVLNAPATFLESLWTIPHEIMLRNEIPADEQIGFVMIFATRRDELSRQLKEIYPRLQGDAVVWAIYPKGTSRKFTCDFNRDSSGEIFLPYDMLAVRQVSIDDDWSALRFRKRKYIKSVTRKSVF